MHSLPDLKGKRALVTGAALRTGRAMAKALAIAGADVIVHYHSSKEHAEQLQSELRDDGVLISLLQLDFSELENIMPAIEEECQMHGPIDILVNNIGYAIWKDFLELTVDEWRQSIDLTISCTHFCCQAVLKGMRERGGGHIINLLDADADIIAPTPKALPYKIGKTGLLIYTKTLAQSEAPFQIAVNAISPGTLENSELKPELDEIPAGRFGNYDDIISALYYLASCPSYITGNNIKISGAYKL